MTTFTATESQLAWDQGFVAKASLPSVWASRVDGGGRIVIGGSFVRSHGIARPNLARLSQTDRWMRALIRAAGPTARFGPSISDRTGRFSSVEPSPATTVQAASGGLVLVEPDGSPSTAVVAQPSSNTVRYIGIDGNGRAIVAGAFESIGESLPRELPAWVRMARSMAMRTKAVRSLRASVPVMQCTPYCHCPTEACSSAATSASTEEWHEETSPRLEMMVPGSRFRSSGRSERPNSPNLYPGRQQADCGRGIYLLRRPPREWHRPPQAVRRSRYRSR